MLRLLARFAAVILCFAPLFRQRDWRHAEVLLLGAILTPGRRPVASILRITRLGRERRFVSYHRVLNRRDGGRPAPMPVIQPCTALATNSGLLSDRMYVGAPRAKNRSASTSITAPKLACGWCTSLPSATAP